LIDREKMRDHQGTGGYHHKESAPYCKSLLKGKKEKEGGGEKMTPERQI